MPDFFISAVGRMVGSLADTADLRYKMQTFLVTHRFVDLQDVGSPPKVTTSQHLSNKLRSSI